MWAANEHMDDLFFWQGPALRSIDERIGFSKRQSTVVYARSKAGKWAHRSRSKVAKVPLFSRDPRHTRTPPDQPARLALCLGSLAQQLACTYPPPFLNYHPLLVPNDRLRTRGSPSQNPSFRVGGGGCRGGGAAGMFVLWPKLFGFAGLGQPAAASCLGVGVGRVGVSACCVRLDVGCPR